MIIHFERDASYYAEQSHKAEEQGRLFDALRYADKARSLSPNFEHCFHYASLLNDVECYLESAVACYQMRSFTLTGEQLKEWIRLVADNAQEQNALPAVIHYNQEYLRAAEADEAQELLEEYMSRWDEDEKRKLQFSDKLHDEDNRNLYRQAVEAYEAGDYALAVALASSIEEGYALHKEGLFVRGMSKASMGDMDGAKIDLVTMYALSRDPRVLLHLDEISPLSDEELRGLLSQAKLEDEEDYLVSSSLASRHRLDEMAETWMANALELDPFDPFVTYNYAAALLNVGEKEDAYLLMREGKELHSFLPSDLLSAPLMRLTVARDGLPPEWNEWLTALVKDKARESDFSLQEALLSKSFREDVKYLLCYGEDAVGLWIADLLNQFVSMETVKLAREVLLFPRLSPIVCHRMLKLLLFGVRRGRVAVAFHYIYQTYHLKVPASFDDMSEVLKEAFCNAYFEMAFSLKQNETKLARLVEKVYLTPPEWDYSPEVMGTAMWTVVCLNKRESQNMGSLLDSRGLDPTEFALAVTYLKSLQNG